MRYFLLVMIFVFVSCQPSGKKTSSNDKANEEFATNVAGTDLLDTTLDVPIEITGNQIVFKQSFSDSAVGVRISCELAVTQGEIYDYSISGSSLVIRTSTGQSMNFSRVSGDGGVIGVWTSRSRSGDQLILRRLSFVSENRLIMRTHCEG